MIAYVFHLRNELLCHVFENISEKMYTILRKTNYPNLNIAMYIENESNYPSNG